MSKRAEEAALTAYPPKFTSPKRYAKRVQSEKVDTHTAARRLFQKGYEQAEQDLALSWEDIADIIELYNKKREQDAAFDYQDYEEILEKFNEKRKK